MNPRHRRTPQRFHARPAPPAPAPNLGRGAAPAAGVRALGEGRVTSTPPRPSVD